MAITFITKIIYNLIHKGILKSSQNSEVIK